MQILSRSLLLAALLASGPALAARSEPPPPPPTEQQIDAASFEDWRARADAAEEAKRKAEAEADAAKDRKNRRKAAERRPPPASSKDQPPDPFLIRVQILLDRAHASPGVIDGHDGDNLKKAVRAFRVMRGLDIEGGIDDAFWRALSADAGKATRVYEVTREDAEGRYVGKKLPSDYAKLAKLKWIGYRDAAEMLAERFHMDEDALVALNPGVDFGAAGSRILVADTGAPAMGKVTRIVVDKKEGELRGYDDAGTVLLAAPATIGSPDTPSPEGKMKVTKAYPDPHYVYDPKKNFQQGNNRRKLTLKPGPNGPVGSMWIDLTKPTYGIHGTPEPSQISKTASHGCVRLTNWDAGELGAMIVDDRTTVEFE